MTTIQVVNCKHAILKKEMQCLKNKNVYSDKVSNRSRVFRGPVDGFEGATRDFTPKTLPTTSCFGNISKNSILHLMH